jgi:hypothetical protein
METNVEVLRKYRDLFPLVEIKNGQEKKRASAGSCSMTRQAIHLPLVGHSTRVVMPKENEPMCRKDLKTVD